MTDRIEVEFPILKRVTYLNTSRSGLLPKSVMEFRRQQDQEFFEQGSQFKVNASVYLAETREAVGRFFKCQPNHVALVPNFSYGFNTLLEGLPEDTSFLLLPDDYPSINWPVQNRSFTIKYVEISADLEANISKAFSKMQPNVFAFSIVQYISGIKIDLEFIKQLKQDYPETLFVADGTQFCGTSKFNFKASGIDVFGASTYKWMNAGYGNGFFLFKDNVAEKVTPKTTGFNSTIGKYKQQDGSFIGKFEPGHQDTLNFGSLKVAIELIESFGIESIQHKIEELSQTTKEEFEALGLLKEMVVGRKEHSSIFNIKGDDALFQKLNAKNIFCSQRGDGIRVSFQYFNTENDLQKLLNALE